MVGTFITVLFIIGLLISRQSGEDDVSQFDSKFTKQTPVDSPDDSMLSESANMVFEVCCLVMFLYYR